MKRRDFIKVTTGTTAGIASAGTVRIFAGPDEKPPTGPPDLAIVHGTSPEAITRSAVEAMGGMKRFVSKGDVVVVKPNMGWDRKPEQAANTNPAVMAAVVKMCFDAGAKRVKVFDFTCNDARRCYVNSGIKTAAQSAGAEVSFINERKFKDVAIKGGVAITSWPLYSEAMDADVVVNVPIAKHHSLSGLTMALKNGMGIMGDPRGRVHQKIHEALIDLTLVYKPQLTILDAVRVLTKNGPQGGNLKDVKQLDTVVAGIDQVAVDSYGATLFGKKGEDLGYVRAGARRGAGVADLTKLNIKKIEV